MRKSDVWATVRDLARWHLTTQIGARRNALVACTELAQRRRERQDVELMLSRTKPTDTALPDNHVRRPSEAIPTTEIAR